MILVTLNRDVYHIVAICGTRSDHTIECDVYDQLDANADSNPDVPGMVYLLKRSAQSGPPRNKEKSRHLRNGIWEFKHKRLRVFYFYDAGKLIICTHSFVKKTNDPTPTKQINHADQCMAQYLADKGRNDIRIIDSL